MAQYLFTTRWHLDAPIDLVWETIARAEDYPTWWPYVAQTQMLEGEKSDELGQLWSVHWKTALPYELVIATRTTRVERPHLRELSSSGELVGTGIWTLAEVDGGTDVQYEWNVRTSQTWMNLLAPFMHIVFTWNHHQVMHSGATGMADYLDVAVRDIEHRQDVLIAGRPAGQVSAILAGVLLLGGLTLRARRGASARAAR